MARSTRSVRKTLLIFGEGDTEVAFLRHLRSVYCSNYAGVNVTIRNAHGKGPGHVIHETVKYARGMAYDTKAALLDTDIEWSVKVLKVIKTNKITAIGASPCIEGLYLSILGQRAPENSDDCKRQAAATMRIDLLEPRDYAKCFPQNVLEESRKTVPALDALLNCFEGK